MPNKLIQYAFNAGVLSRSFHGRSDIEKYGLGLKDADNFFIDYRGGATSRAGTEFVDQIESGSKVRLFHFRYNRELDNNYLLVFTPNKLRFVQNGAYVLEAAKAVTAVSVYNIVVPGHGYANGDLVVAGGRTGIVTVLSSSTINLSDFGGNLFSTTATEVARVYTVSTPFGGGSLQSMDLKQRQNTVRICTTQHRRRLLTFNGPTDWTITNFPNGEASVNAPANVTCTPSGSGTATTNVAVTAVDEDGRETPLSSITTVSSMVNYAEVEGSLRITWNRVTGAKYYRVYRSLIFPLAAQSSLGQQLGYIGQTYGSAFTDANITPDFSISPPIKTDPFENAYIKEVTITNVGSGYTSIPSVAITDPDGSGFKGLVVMETLTGLHGSGTIDSVLVLDAGKGYSAPVVSFSGGGGSGAAGTAVVSEATGNYPSCSADYGQRFWFAGTTNAPMTIYGSRLDDPYSFFKSGLQTAIDPVILDIDSPEMTPILHMETLGQSLFIFTGIGVWQLQQDGDQFVASPKTLNGAGVVPPLKIEREIIYTLPDGTGCYAIRPNLQVNYYEDADVAFYSPDLFTKEQEIVAWTYAREPFRIIWAATADGRLRSFTYVPTQNTYAWASHSTQGYVKACESVLENGISRLYLVIEREGQLFIERMAHRIFATVEDIWGVDCGLASARTFPAATLTITGSGEILSCAANADVFEAADVGSMIRVGGGRGVVVSCTSPADIEIQVISDITDREPQKPSTYPSFAAGSWSLDPPRLTFSGLYHLEGQVVQAWADGSYVGSYTVFEGAITLDNPASFVIVGLPFEATLETLPPLASDQVIDDRRKRIVGVALRIEETRGLAYGTGDNYYEMKERAAEGYGEPTDFQSGLYPLTVRADWRDEATLQVKKTGPGAISLLGVIFDVELGDDV